MTTTRATSKVTSSMAKEFSLMIKATLMKNSMNNMINILDHASRKTSTSDHSYVACLKGLAPYIIPMEINVGSIGTMVR